MLSPSIISKLESTSSLKEEQKMTLEAFFNGKDVFAVLLTSLGKSLIAL